jgi:nucleoside 2-deoxyribosyltransferase
MKIFCAYAFTGEDLDSVTHRMRLVVDTLSVGGHDVYCNRFDDAVPPLQASNDTKGIFRLAFKNIEESDAVVAIVTSPNRSVGQIMEIGAALSRGKPIYLFEHMSAAGSSYLPSVVDGYFQWETLDDLAAALRQV